MPRGIPRSYLETDTTLASNSDLKVPSTKAVRAYIATAGGGSVTLETPTGDVDGVNDEFVFEGTPVAVILNGIIQKPTTEVVIAGNTATFVTPPPDTQGAWVAGLVT